MAGRRLAIIGAGPIGLEAAVRGQQSGWDVTLLEQGTIGNHVADWGHVRLFSPFGMNASARGREALAGPALPADDALLTGHEFVARYLQPLSQLPLLAGRIRERTRVVSISRSDFWKGDRIGKPSRSESPFRLLIEVDQEREETIEADVVFDCTGTFSQHNWLGAEASRVLASVPPLTGSTIRFPTSAGSTGNDLRESRRWLPAAAIRQQRPLLHFRDWPTMRRTLAASG